MSNQTYLKFSPHPPLSPCQPVGRGRGGGEGDEMLEENSEI
jgi:hypothetical protein